MAEHGRLRPKDGAGRQVLVVESPAKARTIAGWLGSGFRVIATRGHVRDLPAKAGSVDPADGFAMRFEAGKGQTLGAIAQALAKADALVLATDPDREGEAIAWQVLDWLEARGAVGDRPVLRAAFHEVPADVFDDLTRVTIINLGDNDLTSLLPGIFDKLAALTGPGARHRARREGPHPAVGSRHHGRAGHSHLRRRADRRRRHAGQPVGTDGAWCWSG